MEPVVPFLQLIALLALLYKMIERVFKRNKHVPKKEPLAISNTRRKDLDLLGRYYDVMKIDHSTSIYPRLVEEQYTSRLTDLMSSNLTESSFMEKLDELEAARSYLHDFIEYMAFKN